MSFLRLIFILPVILLSRPTDAQNMTLEKTRELYFTMNVRENGALNLYFMLKPMDLTRDAKLLAYRGAASAASAASVEGPYKKLQYFSTGKSELEKAIKVRPLDAEIRFLRLATQLNAPGFLGYSGDIGSDKKLIIDALKDARTDDPNGYLYYRISSFLLDSGKLTGDEKKTVSQIRERFRK